MMDPRQVLMKETSLAGEWCYQSLKVTGGGVEACSFEVVIVCPLGS